MASDDPTPQFSEGPNLDEANARLFDTADYTPVLDNWYRARPYGFRYTSKDGETQMVMFLPIGPSNLNITTQFATNVTPTLYGTVEEHSPVRYYDISIEGTTGIAPKYIYPSDATALAKPGTGRTSFAIQQALSTQVGGFFAKTLQVVDNVLSSVKNIVGTITGNDGVTGVQLDQTGYYAFHNLYRFLLKYKKNASGTDESKGQPRTTDLPPLVFFNYKDNNEYTVAVRSFILRRDRNDPMLYNYAITMRGYDLKDVASSASINSPQTVQEMQHQFGLDGVRGSTILSTMKNISSQAKGVLGSVANGINQLGR